MPPKEDPSFPPPFECQMEQRGTGGCCGGNEWITVTAHLQIAPDGQSLNLHVKGAEEDIETGEKTFVVTHVDTFDESRKYISLTGSFDNNETSCRFAKNDVKLKKWGIQYKIFHKLKLDRDRVQQASAKAHYGATQASNTTTDENPIPEDPALSDPTGIMWVGTIFALDKDNDGKIDVNNDAEYKLEFDILVKHDDAEATTLEMSGSQIADLCNKLIKTQILARDKLFPKMMKMSTKEISFFLKPPGSAAEAPKVQVYCSAARYESLRTIVFILASEYTEKSACGGLVLDIIGGGDLGAGLLAKHFEEGCKGYTNKNPQPGNLFEGYNKQKRDAFEKALTERIKVRNDIYHENVRLAAQNEQDLKKLKASLLQNMETIEERSIKIKRNRKAAETMRGNVGALLKKAQVVESVACWKHCKWILCVSILITLILTGVVVFLYFYLKK